MHELHYRILVVERTGAELELCRVANNPQNIVEALKAKLVDEEPRRRNRAKKYSRVWYEIAGKNVTDLGARRRRKARR